MGLSAPQTIFGIHSFTFFNRATKLPIGILKAVGKVEANLGGSFVDLNGGSSRFAWDSEPGLLNFEIKLQSKSFESFLYQPCLGGSAVTTGAEATGNVTTLTNQKGTSVKSATTGIATATAKSGSEADLKDGLYVVKAVSATTVNVYCMSDVDFGQGTAETFVDDNLKITAAALTITATTGVDVPGFGLTLTGGSGTIALVTGDTAYFYVRKENSGNDVITVGASPQVFTEFGCFWASQKKADGNVTDIYVPRAKAIGLPLNFSEMAWATADITIKGLYDSTDNCVFTQRNIRA